VEASLKKLGDLVEYIGERPSRMAAALAAHTAIMSALLAAAFLQ
jgi:hypothetical protein